MNEMNLAVLVTIILFNMVCLGFMLWPARRNRLKRRQTPVFMVYKAE